MLVRVIKAKNSHFFFGGGGIFSSIQNISILSGMQYLSKQEVRSLSLTINIVPLPMSYLSNLCIAE